MNPVDGGLLAPGTSVLPVGQRFAYVADGGNGKLLVAKDGPTAPNKFGGAWVSAPLPAGWSCNEASLMYKQRNAIGQTVTSTTFRPPPNKIASKSLNDLQRLRREYELAYLQVVGKKDSNSYLRWVAVKQRDKEFNLVGTSRVETLASSR
jgi:hypothetical protein